MQAVNEVKKSEEMIKNLEADYQEPLSWEEQRARNKMADRKRGVYGAW